MQMPFTHSPGPKQSDVNWQLPPGSLNTHHRTGTANASLACTMALSLRHVKLRCARSSANCSLAVSSWPQCRAQLLSRKQTANPLQCRTLLYELCQCRIHLSGSEEVGDLGHPQQHLQSLARRNRLHKTYESCC